LYEISKVNSNVGCGIGPAEFFDLLQAGNDRRPGTRDREIHG
jgi:hypothetical protein